MAPSYLEWGLAPLSRIWLLQRAIRYPLNFPWGSTKLLHFSWMQRQSRAAYHFWKFTHTSCLECWMEAMKSSFSNKIWWLHQIKWNRSTKEALQEKQQTVTTACGESGTLTFISHCQKWQWLIPVSPFAKFTPPYIFDITKEAVSSAWIFYLYIVNTEVKL